MADKLHSFGYEYISLDCGYSTKRRDAEGALVVNTTRYPHGMSWLGTKIHSLGLKFGMYASMGWGQCCSQIDKNATDGTGPGCSRGGQCRETSYYEQDAKLFASWGVDYLKFDGCGGPRPSVVAMQAALNNTGRPMTYSINSPSPQVNATNPTYANMWRTTPDTSNTYASLMTTAWLNDNATHTVKQARGAWNDADMLEVGNFFDEFGDAEGRTNFALWCLMKAPLILGTDLSNMTAPTLATITNKAAIAVSKDTLGEQGLLRTSSLWQPQSKHVDLEHPPIGFQVWTGALSKGGATAVLANLDMSAKSIILHPSEMPASRQGVAAAWHITEAFSGKVQCLRCALPQTVQVGPHDVAMWTMTPAK